MTRRPLLIAGVLCLACLVLGGVEPAGAHPQSALEPAGSAARNIEWLWWVLFWVCTAVFLVVLVLTGYALTRRSAKGPQPGEKFVIFAGIVLPTLVLVGLLLASLETGRALRGQKTQLTIRVVGQQYWWDVIYPDSGIVTANEIHIPAGVPVRLELATDDVIHSFWAPNLSGKMDMIPGLTHQLVIEADRPGVWRAQCAEFCGAAHARMALWVVALEPEAFEAWIADRSEPPLPSDEPPIARGREVYLAQRCDSCHAINDRGARIGPDLTRFGSRRSIGAATLPNTPENLARWIEDPQEVKPGNLMPPFDLPPDDMAALVNYLESLK